LNTRKLKKKEPGRGGRTLNFGKNCTALNGNRKQQGGENKPGVQHPMVSLVRWMNPYTREVITSNVFVGKKGGKIKRD